MSFLEGLPLPSGLGAIYQLGLYIGGAYDAHHPRVPGQVFGRSPASFRIAAAERARLGIGNNVTPSSGRAPTATRGSRGFENVRGGGAFPESVPAGKTPVLQEAMEGFKQTPGVKALGKAYEFLKPLGRLAEELYRISEVGIAIAIAELLNQAVNGMVGVDEARERAEVLRAEAYKALTEERHRQEDRAERQKDRDIAERKMQVEEMDRKAREHYNEMKREADEMEAKRQRAAEEAIRKDAQIQAAQQERLRKIGIAVQAIGGFVGPVVMGKIAGKPKAASTNVSVSGAPAQLAYTPAPGGLGYIPVGGTTLLSPLLTRSNATALASGARAATAGATRVCYDRKPRARRRRKKTRRVCYERAVK